MRKVVCPYCGGYAVFTDSTAVYGMSYGKIWLCRKCRAWVGVKKGTDIPLGDLADKELRKLRRDAHAAFDRIWRKGGHMTRKEAYEWLAHEMTLPRQETHIGMFDTYKCRMVIDLCNRYFKEEQSWD